MSIPEGVAKQQERLQPCLLKSELAMPFRAAFSSRPVEIGVGSDGLAVGIQRLPPS